MNITISTSYCDRIQMVLIDLDRDRSITGYDLKDGRLRKGFPGIRRDCVWVEVNFDQAEVYDSARGWINPDGRYDVDHKTWSGRTLSEEERSIITAATELAKKQEADYLERQRYFFEEVWPKLDGKTPKQAIAYILKESPPLAGKTTV